MKMVWLVLPTIITGWTYEAETEVQQCRDALSSNGVSVYTTGLKYFLTNYPMDGYADNPPIRGTHTLKVSPDILDQFAECIQQTLGQPPLTTSPSTTIFGDKMDNNADCNGEMIKIVFWLGICLGIAGFICGYAVCWAVINWPLIGPVGYARLW